MLLARTNGTGGLGRPSAGAGPPPRQSARTRPNLTSRSGVGVRYSCSKWGTTVRCPFLYTAVELYMYNSSANNRY